MKTREFPIKILNGSQLKTLAMASMTLDHMNKSLVIEWLPNHPIYPYLTSLLDILGRLAFPLFAFLLVEGFYHTKSRPAYVKNILVFALLSEIPFDLFTSAEVFNPRWNNVLFSLGLALGTLWLIDNLKDKTKKAPYLYWLGTLAILVFSCGLAIFCNFDYDYHAILVTYFFYIFRHKPILAGLGGYLTLIKEPWSILGFLLTLTYNGERGRMNKWIGYGFYPGHLLLLGLARVYWGF